MKIPFRLCSVVIITAALAGCATTPGASSDPRDPFERYNRAMYSFNQGVDNTVIKPAAIAYADILPVFFQNMVGNFFGNIGDVWTAVNNFLQGKPRDGTTDAMRVVFNSTLGLGGLLDICTPAGIPKHEEDFGQTLAVWGMKSGPYVVLPVFGSSTLRDSFAKPIDLYVDPVAHVDHVPTRNVARAVRLVDDRAALLGTSTILDGAALDPYEFTRDAYLQRRQSRITDGD
jgi:phospholipid-binding lipoprotein MlaA